MMGQNQSSPPHRCGSPSPAAPVQGFKVRDLLAIKPRWLRMATMTTQVLLMANSRASCCVPGSVLELQLSNLQVLIAHQQLQCFQGERRIREDKGVNMIKVHYICMYGNITTKPFCTINICNKE
jgi:hypothetical protein